MQTRSALLFRIPSPFAIADENATITVRRKVGNVALVRPLGHVVLDVTNLLAQAFVQAVYRRELVQEFHLRLLDTTG